MSARDTDIAAELATLEADLRAAGAFQHETARVLRAWLLGLVLGFGGLALSWASWVPLGARAVGLLVSTAGFVAMATIGHTASHGGFSEDKRANRALFYVSYPFFLMVSARYWLHSHVHAHHAAPNVLGVDPDCDHRPIFALNTQHQSEAGTLTRWLYRLQGYLFPVMLPFNGFNIQRQGWIRLAQELGDPGRRSPAALIDLACMLGHVAVFIVLPMAWTPPAIALAHYALRVMLIGVLLFAILAPGHFPAEAACLASTERHRGHFWQRQTTTTVNFRTGPIGRWLCSGLEYQIEHHLMPRVNHIHLPAVRDRVRAVCKRHGLPHRTLGWGEAIWKSYRVFFQPKPVVLLSAPPSPVPGDR